MSRSGVAWHVHRPRLVSELSRGKPFAGRPRVELSRYAEVLSSREDVIWTDRAPYGSFKRTGAAYCETPTHLREYGIERLQPPDDWGYYERLTPCQAGPAPGAGSGPRGSGRQGSGPYGSAAVRARR